MSIREAKEDPRLQIQFAITRLTELEANIINGVNSLTQLATTFQNPRNQQLLKVTTRSLGLELLNISVLKKIAEDALRSVDKG